MKKAPKVHLVLINVILITAFLLSSCAEISPGDSIVFFLLRAFKDRIYEELGDLTRKYQAINMDDPMDPEDYTNDEPPIVIIVTATPAAAAEATAEPTGEPLEGEPPIVIVIPENSSSAPPPSAEEKAPLPDIPVTYIGDMGGCPFSMTVDFQSGEVTGNCSYTDSTSYTSMEIEGTIDTTTLTVTTTYSGITASTEYGIQAPISGAIFGPISADYSTYSASWINESGDTGEFTATR